MKNRIAYKQNVYSFTKARGVFLSSTSFNIFSTLKMINDHILEFGLNYLNYDAERDTLTAVARGSKIINIRYPGKPKQKIEEVTTQNDGIVGMVKDPCNG